MDAPDFPPTHPQRQTTTTLLNAWENISSTLEVDESDEMQDFGPSVCGWRECHGLERTDKMMYIVLEMSNFEILWI
jgi:hypothetical protein